MDDEDDTALVVACVSIVIAVLVLLLQSFLVQNRNGKGNIKYGFGSTLNNVNSSVHTTSCYLNSPTVQSSYTTCEWTFIPLMIYLHLWSLI